MGSTGAAKCDSFMFASQSYHRVCGAGGASPSGRLSRRMEHCHTSHITCAMSKENMTIE